MKRLTVNNKYILILTSIFFFILGCTITQYFIKIDDCESKILLNSISADAKNRWLMVIVILTKPGSLKRRNLLRESWVSYCSENIGLQCFFVIGTKDLPNDSYHSLVNEKEKYNDLLLLEDIADTYETLTKKVLETFMKLAELSEFEFVLKCDDDTFVRLPELIEELKKLTPDQADNLYWGFFNGKGVIKKQGKWQEKEWILCDYYLPYALGGGYVLSQRLVHYIARNGKDLQMYKSEDVSVGVWLANLANVYRFHDPRFDTEYMSRGCFNSYLITHKRTELEQLAMYQRIQETGSLCDEEYRTRLSYNYNWNVPPSQCCHREDPNIP